MPQGRFLPPTSQRGLSWYPRAAKGAGTPVSRVLGKRGAGSAAPHRGWGGRSWAQSEARVRRAGAGPLTAVVSGSEQGEAPGDPASGGTRLRESGEQDLSCGRTQKDRVLCVASDTLQYLNWGAFFLDVIVLHLPRGPRLGEEGGPKVCDVL